MRNVDNGEVMHVWKGAHEEYLHLPFNFVMNLQVTQSCLTLCDPMDYTVCGIL